MNEVQIMGRLTKDPNMSIGAGGKKNTKYTIAVPRPYRDEKGEHPADFIPCIAFDKEAEFAEKYLYRGARVIVIGSIRTSNYVNKEGMKIYATNILIRHHEFIEWRNDPEDLPEGSFMEDELSIVGDEGLPFA